MTITTELFKAREFEDLKLVDAGPEVLQRYSSIDMGDLRSFGANDNISSFRLSCDEANTGATIIFYEHPADQTYKDNPPRNRFDAFTCDANSQIELDRLPRGQEDRTSHVLVVRRALERETTFFLSNNFIWQNRQAIFGTFLGSIDPRLANSLQYTKVRIVPVAPDRVLLGIAFGFDHISLPIVRNIDADGEILVDIEVQDRQLVANFAGYRFDADGFRPVRKRIERLVARELDNPLNQQLISLALTALLAQFFAGGTDVYLLPGDARSHSPRSPVTGDVSNSGASIVMKF